MSENKKWYAVYTKSRCEKKVAEILTKKGVENYCPLIKVHKLWSDRKKTILEPLFKSYVFVKIDALEQLKVRETHGILNFVHWLNKPATIRNDEIEIIKRFLNDYDYIKLEKIAININDRVSVINGPLMELEGQVISIKNKTVKIKLPSLGYLMHAEIEYSNVKIIQESVSLKKIILNN